MKIVFKTTMILLSCIWSLSSCEETDQMVLIRRFTVRQGEHYSTPKLAESLQSDRLIFKASFDETAQYDLGNEALQTNKNKLLGFADCNSQHHDNSARFAWQWFHNQLEIYSYCYANGERLEQYLGTVGIGEQNTFEIRLKDHTYEFYINSELRGVERRGTVDKKGVYYMLWPYFGGSVPAPHDVNVFIQILQ